MASAAEPAHEPVAPDPQLIEDEEDPFSSEGNASSTSSLHSSIYNHIYENGRRYGSYRPRDQYPLPNDEQEQDRLDFSHHLFTLSLNGAYCATKLINPQMILDVGTGTGIWAIDMGDLYPSAAVIGTDLSPIQPLWVPPNVRFEIDDATREWTFPEDHFDFIHVRTLAAGIRDWPGFLAQCMRCLKPGGQIEVTECRANFFCNDDTFPADSYTKQWLDEFFRLCGLVGLNIDHIHGAPKLLEDAGFLSVDTLNTVVPVGSWPKDKKLKAIGKVFREQFLTSALEGYSIALFMNVGQWTQEAFTALCAHVRSEVLSNRMHLYTFCSFVTGKKPEGPEPLDEPQPAGTPLIEHEPVFPTEPAPAEHRPNEPIPSDPVQHQHGHEDPVHQDQHQSVGYDPVRESNQQNAAER